MVTLTDGDGFSKPSRANKHAYLPDINPTQVQLALQTLRDEEDLSLQTLNHYLRSMRKRIGPYA